MLGLVVRYEFDDCIQECIRIVLISNNLVSVQMDPQRGPHCCTSIWAGPDYPICLKIRLYNGGRQCGEEFWLKLERNWCSNVIENTFLSRLFFSTTVKFTILYTTDTEFETTHLKSRIDWTTNTSFETILPQMDD